MSEKTFAAFFSYVHDDDAHDNGRITKLRQMLEEEVRALSGEDFEIFQDYEDIHWGQKWEERLNGALDGSTFLISVVTPRYIRREFCRKEILRFLEREKQLKRNDLVLSIYYIDTDLSSDDVVTSSLSSRQYYDWRDLRHEPYTNPEVSKRIEKMAREIITSIKRSNVLPRTKDFELIRKREPSKLPGVQSTEATLSAETRQPAKRTEPPVLIVDPMPRHGDYTTITKAIEAAEPGTRILIHPGLYKENLKLEKPLELIGDGERDEIVIEARESHVIMFNTEFGRISNLTLRQTSRRQFYGVSISQGRLELEDCDITSQSIACIAIYDSADPRLRRNRIHDGQMGGVYVYQNGRGTLENNEIFGNATSGIAITEGGDPTLRHNFIHTGRGSGVYVYENGKGTLEDNNISNNAGAGLEIRTGSYPTLRRNTITKNNYEGIWVSENAGGIFEENDLRGNIRGAWDIDESCKPNIKAKNNTVK